MAKLNPYKNTSVAILESGASGNTENFIKRNVKNEKLAQTILDIIELHKHIAFNEGRTQGKYEVSQALKVIIDVEDPEYLDASPISDFTY
ncbi:MAG: hypothetical protein EHM34_04275 [Nitrosopumilales archaeon]|nr:MAG: hypothetical protein EHM34_04275 [Nitrosopumilales archaeon]